MLTGVILECEAVAARRALHGSGADWCAAQSCFVLVDALKHAFCALVVSHPTVGMQSLGGFWLQASNGISARVALVLLSF